MKQPWYIERVANDTPEIAAKRRADVFTKALEDMSLDITADFEICMPIKMLKEKIGRLDDLVETLNNVPCIDRRRLRTLRLDVESYEERAEMPKKRRCAP